MFFQIVICQNVARSYSRVQNTMAHELVHMFDYCQNQFDFKKLDHVACSEVRAANLTGCSYIGSLIQGFHPAKQIKQAHKVAKYITKFTDHNKNRIILLKSSKITDQL